MYSRTHNRPVKVLSVDIEDALKAEHADESASDTQVWAAAIGIAVTARAHMKRWQLLDVDRIAFGRLDRFCAGTLMLDELVCKDAVCPLSSVLRICCLACCPCVMLRSHCA